MLQPISLDTLTATVQDTATQLYAERRLRVRDLQQGSDTGVANMLQPISLDTLTATVKVTATQLYAERRLRVRDLQQGSDTGVANMLQPISLDTLTATVKDTATQLYAERRLRTPLRSSTLRGGCGYDLQQGSDTGVAYMLQPISLDTLTATVQDTATQHYA
ncbi:hypothetical protein J6590_005726 [Homalodisca vitripennis]|nr:hypothetical protein J6590_005726 [Homalodisca vitripennis]